MHVQKISYGSLSCYCIYNFILTLKYYVVLQFYLKVCLAFILFDHMSLMRTLPTLLEIMQTGRLSWIHIKLQIFETGRPVQ